METRSTRSSPEAESRARLALGAVLAAAAALYAWGIGWGLPSAYGWAPDEIVPSAVSAAAARRFSGGWHDKYPPAHFAALAAVQSLAARAAGDPASSEHARFLAGRMLSLMAALATVALTFAIGRRAVSAAAGAWAAAVLALCAPLVYYAKTANVEAHYLLWTAAALLFGLRVLDGHRVRDYAALGACAAAAVAVKDQAYGMFLLAGPALLLPLARHRRVAEGRPAGLRVLADRRPWIALAASAAVYVALANVAGNPAGFAAHVRIITGAASRDFRMFPATAAGQLALLAETVRHLGFTMGWPALLLAAAAIARAVARRDGRLLALLAPAASYVLSFLCVVLYVYDRFLLPMALVLAVFAGAALAALAGRSGWGRLAAAAILAWSLARAVSVDLLLAHDARYAAEGWLRDHVPPGATVAAVGPLEYLPRLEGLSWRRLGAAPERVRRASPDYVVVNADYAARSDPGTPDQALYAGLEDGTLGYERVLAHRYAPPWSALPLLALQSQGEGKLYSNLDKVNPEIRVYRRRAR